MKAKIELKLKPLPVPDYVYAVQPLKCREDGFNPEPYKFGLSELDAATLNQLCEEFTASVFEKAGKTRPSTCVYRSGSIPVNEINDVNLGTRE